MKPKTTLSRNVRDPHRNFEIDLALAVMCCLVRPGEVVPYDTIAEITGMGHGGPYMIEQRALKKIRCQMLYTSARAVGRELDRRVA